MNQFKTLRDFQEEKIRLLKHKEQYAQRINELGSELTEPRALKGLVKNTLFSKNGSTNGGSGILSLIDDYGSTAAQAAGLFLSSRFLKKSNPWLNLGLTISPFIFKASPALNRVPGELMTSLERLVVFMKRKRD